MFATVISILILAAILFFAIRYIFKEKKKGVKCIGCPAAQDGNCHCGDDVLEQWRKAHPIDK